MAENIYRLLSEGGGFSLPFLVHLYDEARNVDIRLVNDNENVEYNGDTYESSDFSYTPNDSGDSALEIELAEHDRIIDLLEDNYFFHVDIIGVLYDGEVAPLSRDRHLYGEGTWSGKTLSMKLGKDDRLDMSFPAMIFTSYNNRGNT